MKKKLVTLTTIVLIASLLPKTASANQEASHEREYKTWLFSGALSYVSQSVYRGALTSSKPSFLPGIIVTYKNFIRVDPTSIQVFKTHDTFEFGAGLGMFAGDGSPLRTEPELNNFRAARKFSTDINAYITWEPIDSLMISTIFSKGIIQNFGLYSYSSILFPIVPMFSVGAGVGIGDKKNNNYVFGDGATGGVAHYDLLAEFDFPLQIIKETWKNSQIVLTYQQVKISQDKNRRASFVHSDDHPKIFSSIFSFNF